MKNKKTNHFSEKINKVLEVPRGISKNETKITIISFDEMLIKNYRGILEYEELNIKIKTDIGNIDINGFNLNLEEITEDDILIKGKIENIELEKILNEKGE